MLLDLDPMISAKERNELIVSIAEESADLTNIVDDLLVAAKSEAGTLAVVHIPVELRPQVVQVLEGLSGVDRRRVLLDRFSAKGFGDPARLRQIFRNLLSNALRYGGPNIAIHVVSDGAEVRVLVKDDGPGIASVDRGRIFEAYARAHESTGRTFSLGLGLSISRDLAQRMDGDLTYRYERGESVFELVLPRAP